MENLASWLETNIGKTIIIYDIDGRRWEGIIQRIFPDFLQIYEVKKGMSKIFRLNQIKDFSIISERRSDN